MSDPANELPASPPGRSYSDLVPASPPPPGDPLTAEAVPPQRRLSPRLPRLLFIATLLSTTLVGGPIYALAVMTILTAHELGHYLQARRYGVPASLPYFIPMPLTPIGTMGAVILMQPRTADKRGLFDVAITGPLAGLLPAILASGVGLWLSTVRGAEELAREGPLLSLGEPLFFRWLSWIILGPLEAGSEVVLHPLAYAGWVGFFITALNLLPIGQLDGGHILHCLIPRHAHLVSQVLIAGAVAAVVAGGYWQWSLMIALLLLLRLRHPPTADDHVPLGRGRAVLGWLTLLFFFLGFTPTPFILE